MDCPCGLAAGECDLSVDFRRHRFDPLGEDPDSLRQLGVLREQCLNALGQRVVLLKHFDHQAGLLLHLLLPLLIDEMQLLTMLRVGNAVRLVAVGLPGLGKQDQRRGIGRLGRKGEVEQDEGKEVELSQLTIATTSLCFGRARRSSRLALGCRSRYP